MPGSLVGDPDRRPRRPAIRKPRRRPLLSVPTPLTRALLDFFRTEVAGGALLLAAAVLALVWANSAAGDGYVRLWDTVVDARLGPVALPHDLHHWVNDGLMTVFFLVVGLEIKRELVAGELRDRRKAVMPVVAAVGGMVVPAAVYLGVVGLGGPAARGWAIPMATDIAFAIGVLALLGRRVPPALRLFVLALAIADDIGAIAVIALGYSEGIRVAPLAVAAVCLAAVAVVGRSPRWSTSVALALGLGAWLAVLQSGIHPTIAGVALGLVIPAGSHAERLEHRLHPLSSFVVVPLFALASAGVRLEGAGLPADGPDVALAVAAGLAAGKVVGISAFSWLAVRLGLGKLPEGTTWPQLVGAAAVAGIGFTVALFIGDLAFDAPALEAQAKLGILTGSLAASLVGVVVLRLAGRRVPAG
ncbi:MAG: Na+/H+ antiporter NhaA [Actinomycetota bacterium]